MMTVAALSSAFRGSGGSGRCVNHFTAADHGEEFLKEVGLLLSHWEDCAVPAKAVLAPKEGNAVHGDSRLQQDGGSSTAKPADPDESATRIQTQVRRYLQQAHFRMHQLKHRLQSIQLERNRALARIERRKTRKLTRLQRKRDKEEEEKTLEYQKVAGIVQYLRRDISRCRKELENHRSLCRELTTENQRLSMANETIFQATRTKELEVKQLQALKDQLQARLMVQKEAIRQCKFQLEEPRMGVCHPSARHRQPQPQQQHHHQEKAKSYEVCIKVNPMKVLSLPPGPRFVYLDTQ
jgi:ribosomal protein S13